MPGVLPATPFLYPILDVALLGGRSLGSLLGVMLDGGVRIVQLRAKQVADGRLVELAREAVARCRAAGVALIVNDRPDVARIVGADGVHVGQDDLAPADVRALLPGAIVGVSTHTLPQLEAALRDPVDYLAVGPVFPTRSKQAPDPVVGVELVARARELARRPIVAVGGITRANARAVVEAGADGLAVVSDLMRAPDLGAALREFAAALAPR